MTGPKRPRRHEDISAAAYAVLEEKGFASATMLAIAKHAKASNETMYRWYGDKVGLFSALIEDNAAVVSALLDEALSEKRDAQATLTALGPVLLTLLTGERAIALNRAAAADATGVLGQTLAQAGRGTVLPKIVAVMAHARDAGQILAGEEEAAGLYLDLLVGDLQIRRVIGAAPVPSRAMIAMRSERACTALFRLLGP